MRLRRERVVDVAIALLDADGLDALSMRRLAARLAVQPGARYVHFAGKQALLDAMADRFLEDFTADWPAGSWDEQFAAASWRLRQVLLSHRDGARVMAGTYVAEPNTVLLGNRAIEILQAAGLPPDRAGWAAFAAFHFVLGHTIEEQAQLELAGRSLKGQLKHADRIGARFVAIVGNGNGEVSLKDMESGEQHELSLPEVIPAILRGGHR